MSNQYSAAVETAREYYNSDDADNFYYTVWGGEDIHVGLYQSDDEPIHDASRRTVARMAELLDGIGPDSRVLDLGGGYGGSCRYLAQTYGARCVSVNISEAENERGRQKNRDQGLDQLVEIVDGDFENVPYDDATFDVVWSQDAFLHSGNRRKVMEEVARVLKPGGQFVFTDPMMADDCPKDVLQPILDRIHLETMGSPGFYRETLKDLGFQEVTFEDHSHQLPRHYGRVLKELQSREDEVSKVVSKDYIERMKKGLQHWVNGGNNGHLAWGIFVFRKQ